MTDDIVGAMKRHVEGTSEIVGRLQEVNHYLRRALPSNVAFALIVCLDGDANKRVSLCSGENKYSGEWANVLRLAAADLSGDGGGTSGEIHDEPLEK